MSLIRQSLRQHLRRPGFALTVILLVTCMVAVNAGVFSAIHALRWKALPYPDAEQLLELRADFRNFGFDVGLSTPLAQSLRAETGVFAAIGGFAGSAPRADNLGRSWQLPRVDAHWLNTLAVPVAIGRGFVADDFLDGAAPVLLLSHAAWQSRFGGDLEVLDREVELGGKRLRVVGVMPQGFAFPDDASHGWVPRVLTPAEREQDASGNVGDLGVIARLQHGQSVQAAHAALDAVMVASPEHAATRSGTGMVPLVRPWRDRLSVGQFEGLLTLQAASLLLLLVAASNLGVLSMERLLGRGPEFGIRRALGASERDVLRCALVDLALPAGLGLIAGLALSTLVLRFLQFHGLMPAHLPFALGLDGPGLLAGAVAALLTLAGSVLAARLIARRRQDSLSQRGRTGGLGRTRASLLVAQIALTVLFSGSAGLLLRSAVNLLSEDTGFDARGVVIAAVDAVGLRHDDGIDHAAAAPRIDAFMQELRGFALSQPGVRAAAIAQMTPFSGWEIVSNFSLPGSEAEIQARQQAVGQDYFAALRLPLRMGRTFAQQDFGDDSPVIVDQLFVDRHLAGRDPLGAQIQVPTQGDGAMRSARIIGVAANVRHERLDESRPMPTVYQPLRQASGTPFLIVHTDADPWALSERIRTEVRMRAAQAETLFSEPLQERIAQTLGARRSLLQLLAGFTLITLLLSGLGVHAVLAFSVRQRTPEFGMRLALGATPSRLLRGVLAQGLRLALPGIALGVGIGMLAAQLLAHQFHGLESWDPASWIAASLCVAAACVLACALPARRAARIQPLTALRQD